MNKQPAAPVSHPLPAIESTANHVSYWWLALFITVIWFVMLGIRTLVPTDEGRYAEMAREMLATGDWITTRLNGIKYFEKPPLQIWMTALAFKLFGLGEWQARLWTGLCGFIGIVLTGVAGTRVFGRDVGWSAALILTSMVFWGAMGHINSLDMGLTGGMTLALAAMMIAQGGNVSGAGRTRWMLFCWAGMALAVLSKGLIGLALPGLVLIIYSIFSRDWALWKRLHVVPGMVIFVLIAVPWFILVSIHNPEFARFFFIHEHFQRFTSHVHHREGAWYYFLPLLIAGVLPWLMVLVQSLWAAGKQTESSGFQPKKLLLIWSVSIFVFFSISGSKLPSYILPIFPALALLIAVQLQHASRRVWLLLAATAGLAGIALLVVTPLLPKFAHEPAEVLNFQASQPWAIAAGFVLVAGALLTWYVSWHKGSYRSRGSHHNLRARALPLLSVSSFVAVQLLMLGAQPQGYTRAGLGLVPAIESELTSSMPLYAVGMYDQTLPFYLRRTMTLVEHADEMEFGLEHEPQLWIPTMPAFIERWKNGPKAIAITRPEIYRRLKTDQVPMRILAQDSRRVVITNR